MLFVIVKIHLVVNNKNISDFENKFFNIDIGQRNYKTQNIKQTTQ